jgi:hypothetical protein
VVSETTYELTAKDIPWLMEAIEDFREEGHNKTADMLDEDCRKYFLRNNIARHKLHPSANAF